MTNETFAIAARNVTRKFNDVTALDDISLNIEENTISALLGANGAGKTTLMSLIAGHDRPSSGSVRVAGQIPFESQVVAANTSFIRDNQRYPDNYYLRHALRSAALFHKNWYPVFDAMYTKMCIIPYEIHMLNLY